MRKDSCNEPSEIGCSVTVKVDVARIVRCVCIAGVMIVGIIFGSKCISDYFKSQNQ